MSKQNKRVLYIGTVLFAVLAVTLLALLFFSRARGDADLRNIYLNMLSKDSNGYSADSLAVVNCSYSTAEQIAQSVDGELWMDEALHYGKIVLRNDMTVKSALEKVDDRYLAYLTPEALVYADALSDSFNDTHAAIADSLSFSLMNAGEAHKKTAGSVNGKKVRIAVIDSGIDYTHEEFTGRISPLSYSVSLGKTVNDANGDYSILKTEGSSHGTLVSGVIAASANNGKGIVGLAYDCELVVIKLKVSSNGAFSSADMMAGVEYAIGIGCDVVNLSMGGYSAIPGCDTIFKKAVEKGTVIVCASGNECNSNPHYPSSSRYAISVGALSAYTNTSGKKYEGLKLIASYSNFGNNQVVAPGTWLTTSDSILQSSADKSARNTYGGWYNLANGTSLACPAVAASIGLYKSLYPDAGWDDIRNALFATATDLGDAGFDPYYGYGLINLEAFLNNDTVTVSYSTGSSAADVSFDTQRGSSVNYAPSLKSNEDKVFAGWYLQSSYKTQVDPYSYKFEKNTTLYAKWAKESSAQAQPWELRTADPMLTIIGLMEKAGDKNSFSLRSLTAQKIIDAYPDLSAIPSHYSEVYAIIKANEGENMAKLVTPVLCAGVRQYAVYGYLGTKSEITIPSAVGEIPVTSIAPCAFESSKLTYVEIPDSISKIGFSAFASCSSLSYIQLPITVVYMGENVFNNSKTDVFTALGDPPLGWTRSKSVFGDVSDKYIHEWYGGKGTVHYNSIRSVIENFEIITDISDGKELQILKYLGKEDAVSFSFAGSYDSLVIGEGAFEGVSSVRTVTIPQNIRSIGANAFKDCVALKTVTFEQGSHPETIGEGVFAGCVCLEKMDYPTSLSSVPSDAFNGCSSLYDLNFGTDSKITSIGNGAFNGCLSLSRLTFLECKELQSVGSAFRGCTSLIYLALPDSVSSVSIGALTGAVELQWLELPFVGRTAANNNELCYLFSIDSLDGGKSVPATLKTVVVTKKMSATDTTFRGLSKGSTVYSVNAPVALPEGVIGHFREDWGKIEIQYNNAVYLYLPYAKGEQISHASMPLPGGRALVGFDKNGDGKADALAEGDTSAHLLTKSTGYTVRYLDRTGKEIKKYSDYPYGSRITVPDVEKSYVENGTEYSFAGWSHTVYSVYADLTVTPVYNEGSLYYTVTVKDTGSDRSKTSSVKHGDPVEPLSSYTKDGLLYQFVFDGEWEGQSPVALSDATYYGHFVSTVSKFTVRFVFEDRTVISEKEYSYGDKLEIPADPSMDPTDKYIYQFAGWDHPVAETVTANAMYTARFTPVTRYYSIVFKDEDGRVISEKSDYQYGDNLILPAQPKKEETAGASYEFIGWDHTPEQKVRENGTYVAVYREIAKSFTVTFLDSDGTVICSTEYVYGQLPEPPSAPEKLPTAQMEYVFKGWDGALVAVTEDTEYRAVYEEIQREYTVKLVDSEGKLLYTLTCKYGEMPVLPEGVDKDDLTPAVTVVTGDTTYSVSDRKDNSSGNSGMILMIVGVAIVAVAGVSVPIAVALKKKKSK